MVVALAFAFVVANSVIANLFMKIGADEPRIILGFLGWKSFVGLCFFGVGGLAYSWALRLVPLNAAQSLMSVQYIAIILASWLLLGEVLTPLRLLGIVLIALGILCVSLGSFGKT